MKKQNSNGTRKGGPSAATADSKSATVRSVANPGVGALQDRVVQLEAKIAGMRSSAPTQVIPQSTALSNPQSEIARLQSRILDLEDENDDLQDTLDQISEVASAPDDEDALTTDDLKEKLNSVLDLASDDVEEADEEDSDEGDDDEN